MNKYNSVIVTGSIGYDVIMDFPGKFVDYLQKDKLHQINVSFVVNNLDKQFGGTATNIAYNLSLVTSKKTKIYGSVGKDGGELINFFKKNLINTTGILKDKKIYSSTGSVITDNKDNQIWGYCYGASIYGKNIKLLNFGKSIVVISANHPESFLNFQKQSIKNKWSYMHDCGMTLSWIKKEDLLRGIKNCTWLVGNDYEIALMQKMLNLSINQLIEFGIKVITTLGEKGVMYQSKVGKSVLSGAEGSIKSIKVNAYKVKKVIDPTGAGDAWRGGFLAGILNGKSEVDCLKLGNALASFAVEKYGTVNHKPKIKEIERRIKLI